MKKIIYICFFVISLFLFNSDFVSAINLTENITDENGNSLPDLVINDDITEIYDGRSQWATTWLYYSEDRTWEFFIYYDDYDVLSVMVLADQMKYQWSTGSRTTYNLKVDDNDKSIIYKTGPSATYYILAANLYKVQGQVGSSTNYTYPSLNSWERAFLKFSWNGESWDLTNEYREYGLVKFLYSTRDIYYTTNPNSDDESVLSLFYEGKKFTGEPDVSNLDSIEINDIYSVVFKPKYDSINSTNNLNFIFKSETISSYKHYQNYALIDEEEFSSQWIKKKLDYASLDFEFKTDTIEFIRSTESDKSSTTQGSSGGYHGGGSGVHFDVEINDLVESNIKTGYIYYYSDLFDYCIKLYEDSQCYSQDGTIDNSYFANSSSTDNYISNLISYLKEQNNYFIAFGSIIKYTYFNLPGEIRTFIIASIIIMLICGFIGMIRSR